MSSRGTAVLEHVRKIAEQRKVIALPVLAKPFRADAVVSILRNLKLGDAPAVAARFDLKDALANKWIEYWYQPKINLRQKQLVGAEAFVRARHPEFGPVQPAAFMPGASEDDLLVLAEHSVTSVLEAGARFSEIGINLRLGVNMSIHELVKVPIVDIVRSCRPKVDKWPGMIIDITEEQVKTDIDLAADIAKRLKQLNVHLAIDDFGRRGYSSLTPAEGAAVHGA